MPIYLPTPPPYAEDNPHTSGDRGVFVLAVRNDAGTPLAANGDYSPFSLDSTGALRVNGTSTVSGTARDDTDNQATVATGALLTVDRNYVFDGTNWDRMRAGSPTADPGDVGVTVVSLTASDGTNLRRLFSPAAITDGNGGTGSLSVGQSLFNGATYDRQRSAPGVTGASAVGGPTASDGVLAVAPVTTGGRASNAAPTEVSADGDVVNNWTTRSGRIRVYPSGRRRLGVYNITFTSTVTAAADGATVGRGWLVNNTGSTIFGALRRVTFTATTTTGLLTPTAPIFTIERMTFTGTPTGAQLTPCKRDSTDPTNTVTWRTASTGMTITAGAALTGFQVGGSLLATNMMTPMQYWPIFGDEDQFVILRAGEGIVIRQSTAGTAADTRQGNFDVAWEEFNSTDFTVRD